MTRYKYVRTKSCLYCGKNFTYPAHSVHRKYCSRSCGSKASYNKGSANTLNKVWGYDKKIFDAVMEMYWSGFGGAEIARHFSIPAGTIYSWIHDYGERRVRAEPKVLPKIIRPIIKSPKEQFKEAKSADDWLDALRESAAKSEDTMSEMPIRLVCGVLHGQSAGKLATVIAESLNENPLSGISYAFCNKCYNTITVIAWKAPIYELSKYVKVHGTFIWPGNNLGRIIEVSRSEFDGLLFVKKQRKAMEKIDIMRVSCYN